MLGTIETMKHHETVPPADMQVRTLGEGAFAKVVHCKLKREGQVLRPTCCEQMGNENQGSQGTNPPALFKCCPPELLVVGCTVFARFRQ